MASAPPSPGSIVFDATFTHLSADERRRIHAGVGNCLLYHPGMLGAFYDAWTNWGRLEISDSLGALDGHTQIGIGGLGRTRINRTLMRTFESRLGAVLLHEMMHFRQPRSAFNRASDSQEGEAWGTQVFFADYVGDEEESRRLTGLIQSNFGGEVDFPPAARIRADRAYIAWAFLMDATDSAAGRRQATFPAQVNPVAADPHAFARQFMTDLQWSQAGTGQSVFVAIRDPNSRLTLLRQICRNPIGIIAAYPERRLRDAIV